MEPTSAVVRSDRRSDRDELTSFQRLQRALIFLAAFEASGIVAVRDAGYTGGARRERVVTLSDREVKGSITIAITIRVCGLRH